MSISILADFLTFSTSVHLYRLASACTTRLPFDSADIRASWCVYVCALFTDDGRLLGHAWQYSAAHTAAAAAD